MEDINFLSSNAKIQFKSNYFSKSGGLKLPKWPGFGLNYARFEEFFRVARSVTRIINAWRIISYNNIDPNRIQASHSGRIHFVRLNILILDCDIVQNLYVFNIFPQKLFDMN